MKCRYLLKPITTLSVWHDDTTTCLQHLESTDQDGLHKHNDEWMPFRDSSNIEQSQICGSFRCVGCPALRPPDTLHHRYLARKPMKSAKQKKIKRCLFRHRLPLLLPNHLRENLLLKLQPYVVLHFKTMWLHCCHTGRCCISHV